LVSLCAFVEDKMFAPDYFGGQMGSAVGPPNDPFKVFKWAKRKIHGEKGHVWHKMSVEQFEKWEADGGAVNENGNVDSSTVA